MNDRPPIPAAIDFRSRIAFIIACCIILIVPSLYSFQFTSFMYAKSAGVAVGGLLLAAFVSPERGSNKDNLYRLLPILALIWWAKTVGFVQKSDAMEGAIPYLHLWLIAFLILAAASPRSIQISIAFSIVPVAAMALAQYSGFLRGMFPDFPEYGQRMYSVFGNQDLLGGYIALGLVLGFSLWLARDLASPFATVLFVLGLPTLLLSASRSAWLAAFVGAGFAAWHHRDQFRRISIVAFASVVVLAMVVAMAPGATWKRFSGTFAQADTGYRIRLWIWDGTINLITQHPIAGVGMGNFAYYSPRALGEVLHERGPNVHMFNHLPVDHAHSDPLEIIAETGVVGVALLVAFFVMIPRRRSPAWPALMAAFAFSLINTTLHSPPHALAILLLAGSIPRDGTPLRSKLSRNWLTNFILVIIFGATTAMWVAGPVYSNALLARAQALYANDDPAAEKAYERAWHSMSHVAAAENAVLLANRGQYEQALIALEYAGRGLDTGELYYVRAYLTEQLKHPGAADLYRACLLRWPDHAPAYAGLLRLTGDEDRAAVLAEAKRWLSPEDYASLTASPGVPRPASPREVELSTPTPR